MLTISRVTTTQGFEELKEVWDALVEKSQANSIFLTWEWLYLWWNWYGSAKKLSVLVVKDRGAGLVGLAPLCLSYHRQFGTFMMARLGFLGTGPACSDYLDIVAAPGWEKAVLCAIADDLNREPRWDMLDLTDIQTSSATMCLLPISIKQWAGLSSVNIHPHTVYPYISLPHDWDTYSGSLSKDFRKEISYYERRLCREFSVGFHVAGDQDAVNSNMDSLRCLHASWWSAKGLVGNMAGDVLFGFHKSIAALFLKRGWLKLHSLTLDGEVVGVLYGFQYADRFCYYNSGVSLDHSRYSIGTVLIAHAIRSAIEDGALVFDFLRGASAYKFRWSQSARRTVRIEVYNKTLAARLLRYLNCTTRVLRVAARSMVGRSK